MFKAIRTFVRAWQTPALEPVKRTPGPCHIDELRRLSLRMEDYEALYRGLLENAPFGIVIHNNSVIEYANPAFAELFATTQDRLAGFPITLLIHPVHLALIQRRLAAAKSGKKTPFIRHKAVRFDGKEIDIAVSTIPVDLAGGRSESIVIRSIDIHQEFDGPE